MNTSRTNCCWYVGCIVLPSIYFNVNQVHLVHELAFDGKLCLAPINPNPRNVLDIGTGRGDWAIDFAEYVFARMAIRKPSLLTLAGGTRSAKSLVPT